MCPAARLLSTALLVALLPGAVRAGDADSLPPPPASDAEAGVPATVAVYEPCSDPCWEPSRWSLQGLTGFYPKARIGPGAAPIEDFSASHYKINYVPLTLRLGYEFPRIFFPDTCVQGNFQALFAYNTLIVTENFGSYFTGPSALLRYNYVQPQCLLVPYLQGGAGIVFTDAYRTPVQRLIGRWQEFLLEVGGGIRFRLTEQLSLDVECELQHISNARLAPRNGGINNIGVVAGFTYTFGAK